MAVIAAPTVDPCLMCLPQGQLFAILAYVAAAGANGDTVPTDVQTLLDDSACIESCMPTGAMLASIVGNMITIVNNGGGSGGALPPGVVDPEGVVTGEPGQTYYNTANATFWVKASGSGNTGWMPLV